MVNAGVGVAGARHVLVQYANNGVEADYGRLKSRLRPMRGMKISLLRTGANGQAFVQNLRRGRDELIVDVAVHDRMRVAFAERSFSL